MRINKILLSSLGLVFGIAGSASAQWLQFNHDAQHNGFLSNVQGQNLDTIRFSKVYDSVSGGPLLHYDVPKVDADSNAYIVLRDRVAGQITYGVQKLDSSGNEIWTYTSDYRFVIGGGWEASFSFVVGNGQVYVAGLYGIVHVLDPSDGSFIYDIASYDIPDPIPPGLATGVAVSGPPSIDADGTLYYVVRSTFADVQSHLVKFPVDGMGSTVAFADLTGETSERPGLNSGPAVGPDGTIYVGSVKSASPVQWRLLAVNPDLTLKWIGDMASDPAHVAHVIDQSTSNPLVAPDGRVFYGGHNSNEISDGYLYEFSANGDFQGEYPFGWDSTPAIYPDPDGDPAHYHLIEKKNMYGSGRYYLVSINPDGMTQEWAWELPTAGRELCVNAVVVDSTGTSYLLGEDGYFYRVEFGGVNWTRIMLGPPLSVPYTPSAMGPDGTIYALDNRSFFIIGNQ